MGVHLRNALVHSAPPPLMTGLAYWFDASDAATITIASSRVSVWGDKSGNGRNLAQGSGSKRPTVAAASLNGRDTVNFDGSNDEMATGAFSVGTLSTQFAVVRSPAAVQSDFLTGNVSNETSHIVYFNAADGYLNLYSGTVLSSGIAMAADTWCLVSATTGGASSAIRVNGVEVTGDAGAQNWTSGLKLGSPSFGGAWFPADYAEAIGYDRALTSAETDHVERYLGAKWGF